MLLVLTLISLTVATSEDTGIIGKNIKQHEIGHQHHYPANIYIYPAVLKEINQDEHDTIAENSREKDDSMSKFFKSTKGIIIIVVVVILLISFICGLIYVCYRKFCSRQIETSDIAQYGQVILDENEPLDQLESI